jgi:N utilization substance protein B
MTAAGSNRERIRARRCAVQALYQWQMSGQDPHDIFEEFVTEREVIGVDMDYFSTLTRSIPEHFAILLLLGTYELRFCPDLPWRVVINEGVELCKMFGAEDGYRYVNGILDKLAKKLRRVEIEAAGEKHS